MEVRKVGVVGLGTMGAGIAQVCVQAGFQTVGREVSEELCDRARGTIAHYWRAESRRAGSRRRSTTLRSPG